jgi:hypothetical protein
MAFPKGLKMVAGNPYRRSFNPNSYEDQAVSFVCLDYYNDHSGDPEWEQRNGKSFLVTFRSLFSSSADQD